MAQHKFGTRRRAMLSFERQPFPAPCHVDQDVAHSRAWCALRHLTTFDRVLSALHRRNHLPFPRTLRPAHAATGITVWSAPFTSRVHFGADSDLCATAYLAGAAGPYSMRRATAGWISCDFESEIDVADHRKKPWHSRYPSESRVVTRMFHPAGILMRRNCRRSMSYLIQTDLVRHRGLIIPGLSPNESNAD